MPGRTTFVPSSPCAGFLGLFLGEIPTLPLSNYVTLAKLFMPIELQLSSLSDAECRHADLIGLLEDWVAVREKHLEQSLQA